MLTRIHINNFRSFSDVEIGPLKRINLIAGLNNSGKTGLLEAIFLVLAKNGLPGRPRSGKQAANLPNLFRIFSPQADPNQDFWPWLFRDRNEKKDIEIAVTPSGGLEEGVLLTTKDPGQLAMVKSGTLGPAGNLGTIHVLRPRQSGIDLPVAVFSSHPSDPVQDAIDYNRVILKRGKKKVENLLKQVDDRIEAIDLWSGMIGRTPKTLNEYRNAIFGLCHWLEGRVGTNPMRSVEKVNTSGALKRERRSLTLAELLRLVEVSAERGIVYLVAAWTGIRRGELEEIQWRDVHPDEMRPYITVRASIAKNDQLAHQPLPLFVAGALRQFRQVNVTPTDLVFKRLIPRMNRFRDDLGAAGIAYVDAKGEHADFHALRKTYGTFLMLLGFSEFTRMKLMRHSDVKLTQKVYTDASMAPIWDAIAEPSIFNDTQIDTQKLVASGQTVSAAVPIKENDPILLASGEQTFSPSESASVPKSPELADGARCRVRTCDLSPRRPLYP
jgi:integrase